MTLKRTIELLKEYLRIITCDCKILLMIKTITCDFNFFND